MEARSLVPLSGRAFSRSDHLLPGLLRRQRSLLLVETSDLGVNRSDNVATISRKPANEAVPSASLAARFSMGTPPLEKVDCGVSGKFVMP